MLQAKNKQFRIITPYDAQRSLIEEHLKLQKLDWEDKCFNVDSFQGHEEDYIVISLVRSRALGFLADLRRTNVMLTRCKKGMIICTSQKFMKRAGWNSLVGSLLKYYKHQWIEKDNLERIMV
ncbi:AAA domain-containing protein [Suillus subluteus]|nr:AAA domain-containing protein [Suillus subluteus]